MTAQDWLDLMPIVADRGWTNRGAIRDRDGRCPVCALAHELSGGIINRSWLWMLALQEIGAPAAGANDVANAADNAGHCLRPALVAALWMKLHGLAKASRIG